MTEPQADTSGAWFECPFHHIQVKIESGPRVGCAECIAYYESKSQADADSMFGPHRAAEVRRILEAPMTCSMGIFWPWIDALVGRPVFTHEFAMMEALCIEATNRVHPHLYEIVARAQALMGPDKPVVVVEDSGKPERAPE